MVCFLPCLWQSFSDMSLLLRSAGSVRRVLVRGLFGFGKAGKHRQQIQEAQSRLFSLSFISRDVLGLC